MINFIVANSFILKQFSKIDLFTRELGKNLTGPVDTKKQEVKIKILDEFVKKYQTMTNKLIFRYGRIGKLAFYQDESLNNTELIVYGDEEDIYEVEISDTNTLQINPKDYLGKILSNIMYGPDEEEEIVELNDVEANITNKNNKIPSKPKIDLPYDQLVEEMVNRRKALSKIEIDDDMQALIDKKRKEFDKFMANREEKLRKVNG